MNRRRFVASAAAAGLALPYLARASQPGNAARGVANVGLSALPTSWDPLGSRDFNTQWLSTLVYDSLFHIDQDGNIVPGLALFATWSPDREVLTIDLRGNVHFSDGTAVTASDVVMSLDRARSTSWRLDSVRSTVALSNGSIEITCDSPDAALMSSLASPELPIFPGGAPDFAEQVRKDAPPLGTGPFRPLRINDDDIRLLPNKWYWQIGRPKLSGIRIVGMPEESTRSVALLTNEVDLLPDVPLLDVAVLRQEPSLSLVGGPSSLGCMLILNLHRPPMSRTSFRLLFNRAIDREALASAATGGEATPQHTLLPVGHWGALDDVMEPQDRDQLRQELQDLGYPVGLRLRMVSDERSVSLSNAAVFLQDQLSFLGISLSVELQGEEQLAATLEEGDYDLYATTIGAWNDPHDLFRPLVMSDGPDNVVGYSNAQCDRLIQSGVMIEDIERRAPYYQQLQRILLEDVPFVVLYLQNYFDSMTPRLQNYPRYPPISGLGMRHAWLADSTS